MWAAPAIARLPAAAGAAGSPPIHCGEDPSTSGEVPTSEFVVDSHGAGSFAVPAGVTLLTVEVWGAGGDGSPIPGQGGQGSGGGGGGGWACSAITVSDCTTYSFTVGRAGGGERDGTTRFTADSREVHATGGQNGAGRNGGAGGIGVGENFATGGAGGNGGGNGGGGGGASASRYGFGAPGSDGRDGAGNVGGAGGLANLDAGSGGDGGNRGQMGSNGQGPGGGGGGTGRNGSPAGLGADGKLRITW